MPRLARILGAGLPSRPPMPTDAEKRLGVPELAEAQDLLAEQAVHALLTGLSAQEAEPMDEAVTRIWNGLGIESDHLSDIDNSKTPEQEVLVTAGRLASDATRPLTWSSLAADIGARAADGHRAPGEVRDLAEYQAALARAHHARYQGAQFFDTPEQELAASLAGYLRAREAHGLFTDTTMAATRPSLERAWRVSEAVKPFVDAAGEAQRLERRRATAGSPVGPALVVTAVSLKLGIDHALETTPPSLAVGAAWTAGSMLVMALEYVAVRLALDASYGRKADRVAGRAAQARERLDRTVAWYDKKPLEQHAQLGLPRRR